MCLVSQTGKEMMQYVRSFTEWMGGTIAKEQEASVDPNNKNPGKRKRDEDDEDATNISLRLKWALFLPASSK
jgi:cleavage and polyadenylation specificity factor subunit 2